MDESWNRSNCTRMASRHCLKNPKVSFDLLNLELHTESCPTPCPAEVDPKRKQHFQSKILEYMARAEQVKEQITRWRSRGEIRDKIHVVEGATGYSYGRVFGKYMTDEVKEIMIEEPYVREHHQLCNVVMFCELAVSSCKALKFVKLMTVREKKNNDEQARALQILKDSVKKQGVEFFVEYSEHMHDRQVM